MWLIIDGKDAKVYKSINFSYLKQKLLNGSKDQTIRTNNIPYYEPYECVVIKFKQEPLFLTQITDYFPKQLKDITLEEAKRDGFKTVEQCQNLLMEINNINSLVHYCFLIQWDKAKRVMLDVVGKKGSVWICKTENCIDLTNYAEAME
jgi:hypothetical protein